MALNLKGFKEIKGIPQLLKTSRVVEAIGYPELEGDVPTPPADGEIPEWMPATASVSTDTGFKSPTAIEGGETWDTPTNAFTSDDNDTYSDVEYYQQYRDFDFGVPAGATIDGIEVKVEASRANNNSRIRIYLSWDEAYNWKYKDNTWSGSVGTDETKTYGNSTDTWERTWISSDFANANFILSIVDSSMESPDVDHIQVKIYYTT